MRRVLAAVLAVPVLVLAQYDTMWVRQVSRPPAPGHFNRANDIYVDPGNGVYACGMVQDPTYNVHTMGIVKYSELGDSLWWRGHAGDNYWGANEGFGITGDTRGKVYAVGSGDIIQGPTTDVVAMWFKTDTSGYEPWAVSLRWLGDDVLFDAVVGADGGLYACGTKWNNDAATNEFLVVKIDTLDGDTVWTRSYHLEFTPDGGQDKRHTLGQCIRAHREKELKDPGGAGRGPQDGLPDFYDIYVDYENCATAIAASPDGNIVVTGFGYDDTAYETEMWTMKFGPSGNQLWARTYHNLADTLLMYHDADAAFDVAVASDGNVYICGFDYYETDLYDQGFNYAVVSYNSSGTLQNWISIDGAEYDDCATSLALDNASPENVYTTGWVDYELPWTQITSHKFSHSLVRQWGANGARYGANDTLDAGYDICYQGGRAYVTGSAGDDLAVLCYTDAGGSPKNPLWSYEYRNPGGPSDIGSSIWASDSNHIYFTGQSNRSTSWSSIPIGRLMYTRRDIAAVSILDPAGARVFGTVDTPRAIVRNLGNVPTDFSAHFSITDGYADTVSAFLAIGQQDTLEFAPWTADSSGSFVTRCSVYVADDTGQANNLATGSVGVLPPAPVPESPANGETLATRTPMFSVASTPRDIADRYHFRVWQADSIVSQDTNATAIWQVPRSLYNGRGYTWDCRAHSAAGWGPYFSPRWDFFVKVMPGTPVPVAPPDSADVATLSPAVVVRNLGGDVDRYQFQVFLGDSLVRQDSLADSLWLVTPELTNGRLYNWQCRAHNPAGWGAYFGPKWRFSVKVLPTAPVPTAPANGSRVLTLTPQLSVGPVPGADTYHFRVYESGNLVVEDSTVAGGNWTVSQPLEDGHTYDWDCRARGAGQWGPFFSPRWSFHVLLMTIDAGVTRIIQPSGQVDSGTTVVPSVVVKNYGTDPATMPVWFRVEPHSGLAAGRPAGPAVTSTTLVLNSFDQTYEDSVWVTIQPDESLVVNFNAWIPTVPDTYDLVSFTDLVGDTNPHNDTALGTLRVRRLVRDVGAVKVFAPTGQIDRGTVVTPQATVQNFGDLPVNGLVVRFKIGGFYIRDRTVNLAVGQLDTVDFPAWTADSLGLHAVRCSTMLVGDYNPANDLARDSVRVVPPQAIEEPSGLPTHFALESVRPNPFAAGARIAFALPVESRASVLVYDAAGNLVRTVVSGVCPAGRHVAAWDGRDSKGRVSGPGIYYCRFEAGEFRTTLKLVKLD